MLLGLVGVSGVGKSHFAKLLTEQLGFKRLRIATTRPRRAGESDSDKRFVSVSELEALRQAGEVVFEMTAFGNQYAYLREDMLTPKNAVFEMHYEAIFDFKRACPAELNLKTIYLFPDKLKTAKDKVRERGLDAEAEAVRLADIDQHFQIVTTD